MLSGPYGLFVYLTCKELPVVNLSSDISVSPPLGAKPLLWRGAIGAYRLLKATAFPYSSHSLHPSRAVHEPGGAAQHIVPKHLV